MIADRLGYERRIIVSPHGVRSGVVALLARGGDGGVALLEQPATDRGEPPGSNSTTSTTAAP